MAAAVVALTAACTPGAETETPAVSEAAGPAADAALSAAEEATVEALPDAEAAEPALGENEKPK